MIKNFASENNVSMSHMKYNMFRNIENGIEFEFFFSDLYKALKDNSKNITNDLMKGTISLFFIKISFSL